MVSIAEVSAAIAAIEELMRVTTAHTAQLKEKAAEITAHAVVVLEGSRQEGAQAAVGLLRQLDDDFEQPLRTISAALDSLNSIIL